MAQDPTLKDILEVVEFIRDNAATKDDINRLDAKIDGVEHRLDAKIDGVEHRLDAKIDGVEHRLDAKLQSTKNDMIGHVDGFIALYRKHEFELAAVVSRQERMEEKLNKVLHHIGLTVT